MNKTFNINLGGVPFIINDDAFELLKEYLADIEKGFSNESERQEIMSDIEARIADIFANNLKAARKVVDASDVNYVITQLGRPEDISGAETDTKKKEATNEAGKQSHSSEKKLFRDTENKKIGGVISGLCYYFGLGDPTWVRIGIIVFTILTVFVFHGTSLFTLFVIYMILLVTIPKAQTTAEKLQMKGEPINLQNIEKEVKEAFHNANDSAKEAFSSANESAKEFGKNVNERFNNYQQPTKDAFDRLIKLSMSIAWGFIVFVSVILFILAVSFFTGATAVSSTNFSELVRLLVKDNLRITFLAITFIAIIVIPICYMLYSGINYFVSKEKPSQIIKKTVSGLWIGGVIIGLFTLISIKKDFRLKDTFAKDTASFLPMGDTLYVGTSAHNTSFGFYFNDDDENNEPVKIVTGLEKTENGYIIGSPDFEIAVSDDSLYHLEQVVSTKGRNQKEAVKNSQYVFYNHRLNGDSLLLKNYFELAKNGVWRKQDLTLVLYVPKGKFVKFDKNIDEMCSATAKNDHSLDDLLFGDKVFAAEGDHIICKSEKEIVENADDEKEADNKNLKDVNISFNENGVKISGKDENGNDVKIKINEDGTQIKTTDSTGKTKIVKEKI